VNARLIALGRVLGEVTAAPPNLGRPSINAIPR
jgi:hypothetical protein